MAHGPAPAGRPRFDIADIVRAHRARLEAEHPVSREQGRVLSAIAVCRTAALGGHLDVCRSCGYEHPAYNSCRNRHCPKCQALAQEKWIAARAERLLPVRHFHVVFTVPAELRPLAKRLPRLVYDALFHAASETLLDLGRSRLGGKLGVTAVLHTWTRDLRLHPHVHTLVTAGALATDGATWNVAGTKYLFPVKVMGALLRGKMIDTLRSAHARGDLAGFDPVATPELFERFIARLACNDWVVYAKKPFRRAQHVLQYLGRYTHRVGIANSRLVAVADDAVTFRTKAGKTVSLPPVLFLRRFVQHVLPADFKKIRHYGLYAGASSKSLAAARAATPAAVPSAPALPPSIPPDSWADHLLALTGRDLSRCPVCGGPLTRRPLPPVSPRGPPIPTAP